MDADGGNTPEPFAPKPFHKVTIVSEPNGLALNEPISMSQLG